MKKITSITAPNQEIISKSCTRFVMAYAIVSLVYIYTSDSLLQLMTRNAYLLTEYQTMKGIGFILFTSIVMVYISKGSAKKTSGIYQQVLQTEAERTHESMHKLEQQYMQLFNHIPLPMWIYDTETLGFLRVNEAAVMRYGYTEEEFSEMTIKDIRPIEDQETLNAALATIAGTNTYSWSKSFRHQRKDGSHVYVKIESMATTYQGKAARLVLAMDITAEMNMQQNLHEANNMLRSASEIANLGYWSNDMKTGKIHWSEEMYKIFEVAPETFELQLENIISCFAPDSRSAFAEDVDKAYNLGEVKETQQKILTPIGEKWILQRIALERDKDGNPSKLQGITLDITTRKENERALEESNTRYKMVMQASVDAIIDWDIENDKASWSANFQELFGHDIANYSDDTWIKFIHPDDKERVKQELRIALANKKQEYFYTRFRFLKANGQIAYIKQKGVFVRNAEGRAVRAVGAMIDVTESVQHLQFIEQQNASLREIAWVQSHIVRGPLSTLMGLVDLLKNHDKYDIKPDDLVPDIVSTANKLDDVIKVIVRKSESVDATSALG